MAIEYLVVGLVLVGYYINIGRWTTLILIIKKERAISRTENIKIVSSVIIMIVVYFGVYGLTICNMSNNISKTIPSKGVLNTINFCLLVLIDLIPLCAYCYIWSFMAR